MHSVCAQSADPMEAANPDLAKVALNSSDERNWNGVSRARNEANAASCAEPTICVGQPPKKKKKKTALDPRGRRRGAAILWRQMPEAARVVKGEAAQEIEAPADGRWTRPRASLTPTASAAARPRI